MYLCVLVCLVLRHAYSTIRMCAQCYLYVYMYISFTVMHVMHCSLYIIVAKYVMEGTERPSIIYIITEGYGMHKVHVVKKNHHSNMVAFSMFLIFGIKMQSIE